jgi:hypothetical protein
MPDLILTRGITLTEVFVNLYPLIDDTDFKTIETGVPFDAPGLVLVFNFTNISGTTTQTPVTPTTGGGDYDWVHKGNGMYAISIPDSGGISINNDQAGFGFFTGKATGILPWRGPTIQFSPVQVVESLITGTDQLVVDAPDVLARLATLATKTGAVVDDAANSATSFKTNLTETETNAFKNCLLKFNTGTLAQQTQRIAAYDGTTKFVTVEEAYSAEPAAADTFDIVND